MSVFNEIKNAFENKIYNRFGDVPANVLVEWAEKSQFGEKVFKSSQLRKFYDAVRSIWDDKAVKKLKDADKLDDLFISRLVFLRPHLANAVKKNKMPSDFRQIMELSIQKIQLKKDLYKFVKFFEAIVAYSK